MDSTPLPYTSLSNLFLSYPRKRILDVVMRNLTEPLRYLFLVEMSECELRVSLSKYWWAFLDPFVYTTVYFFKACDENMDRMERFMKRHERRRVYLPPEGALERHELRGSAARQMTVQRGFAEIDAMFASQWQELARRGVIRSRIDVCLLRTAQITGALRRKGDPAMEVLRGLMDGFVLPVLHETPSVAWEHLLRPERQLLDLSASIEMGVGSLLAASDTMGEDKRDTEDRTRLHPAGQVTTHTMDKPKKTRKRSDLVLTPLPPSPKRRKLDESTMEEEDQPQYQYFFPATLPRITIMSNQ